MGKMFQAATNYLPAQVSGMINQDRAFATVRLNTSGQRNVCALSTYVLTPVAPLPRQPLSRHSYLRGTPPCGPLSGNCACCRARSVCLLLPCVRAAIACGLTLLFVLGFRSCLGCW